ncbi:hypothetical protein OTU49_002836 [Cherax quadricarinatus]|uniref:Uncharacterized protein n=1 Tax=Cherax quadricarinatus TaxID=27406 RepID=A0AAW0X8P2_CHEQU
MVWSLLCSSLSSLCSPLCSFYVLPLGLLYALHHAIPMLFTVFLMLSIILSLMLTGSMIAVWEICLFQTRHHSACWPEILPSNPCGTPLHNNLENNNIVPPPAGNIGRFLIKVQKPVKP